MKINEYIEITNEDNMLLMSRYPDNYFDLAVVDPPYGKKPTRDNKGVGGFNSSKNYDNKADLWDVRPEPKYFTELMRVSKNQIVWGANYLIEDLHSSNGWICWDKKNGENIFADFELAFSSFNKRARIFRRYTDKLNRFHPTQKPIELYEWILSNYAEPNQKILDTHLGSGSIAIAVDNMNKIEKMNLTLTACELDAEYFQSATSRIINKTNWQSLF